MKVTLRYQVGWAVSTKTGLYRILSIVNEKKFLYDVEVIEDYTKRKKEK